MEITSADAGKEKLGREVGGSEADREAAAKEKDESEDSGLEFGNFVVLDEVGEHGDAVTGKKNSPKVTEQAEQPTPKTKVKTRENLEYCLICYSSKGKDHNETSFHQANMKLLAEGGKPKKKRGSGLCPFVELRTVRPIIQDDIEASKEPIVGARYIVEHQHEDPSVGPQYACYLCETILERPPVIDHLQETSHRMEYLRVAFPEIHSGLLMIENKKDQAQKVKTCAAKIEQRKGRLTKNLKLFLFLAEHRKVQRVKQPNFPLSILSYQAASKKDKTIPNEQGLEGSVGWQFVTKYTQEGIPDNAVYTCDLCHGHWMTAFALHDHVGGRPHKELYMERYHKDLMAQYNKELPESNPKDLLPKYMIKIGEAEGMKSVKMKRLVVPFAEDTMEPEQSGDAELEQKEDSKYASQNKEEEPKELQSSIQEKDEKTEEESSVPKTDVKTEEQESSHEKKDEKTERRRSSSQQKDGKTEEHKTSSQKKSGGSKRSSSEKGSKRGSDVDVVSKEARAHPRVKENYENLMPNLHGLFTVCFETKETQTMKKLREIFNKVGDVKDVHFSQKFTFLRYGTKKEAVEALIQLGDQYDLRVPEDRAIKRARYREESRKREEERGRDGSHSRLPKHAGRGSFHQGSDPISRESRTHPRVRPFYDYLVPNLKGLFSVCFETKEQKSIPELKGIFGTVGEVAEVSFSQRYTFLRFATKKEAVAALIQFGQQYDLRVPEDRALQRARLREEARKRNEGRDRGMGGPDRWRGNRDSSGLAGRKRGMPSGGGVPNLQPLVDACSEPLVGLQYIEGHPGDGPEDWKYDCGLCKPLRPMGAVQALSHVTGNKHRMEYLTKFYPTLPTDGRGLEAARQVQRKEGRHRISTVGSSRSGLGRRDNSRGPPPKNLRADTGSYRMDDRQNTQQVGAYGAGRTWNQGDNPQRRFEGEGAQYPYSGDYSMSSQGQFADPSSRSMQQQYFGNQGYQYMDDGRSAQQRSDLMQSTGYHGYGNNSSGQDMSQYSSGGPDLGMQRYQDSNVSGYRDGQPQDSYSREHQATQGTGSSSTGRNVNSSRIFTILEGLIETMQSKNNPRH